MTNRIGYLRSILDLSGTREHGSDLREAHEGAVRRESVDEGGGEGGREEREMAEQRSLDEIVHKVLEILAAVRSIS